MCGIAGVVNRGKYGFNQADIDAFKVLMHLNTLRGYDATGMFAVDTLGNVGIAKEAVMAPQFIGKKETDTLLKESFRTGWAMVGHCRAATRGDVNDKNAHPFWVDDKLVLVHNGTYWGDHKHLKNTEVDSEAIAHVIAENNDINVAMEKINAAYALIWYNVEKKTLHILRNNQRPLWCMMSNTAFYFASEGIYLNFIRDKFNIKPEKEPFELAPDVMTTFTLKDDKSMELDIVNIEKPKHTNKWTEKFNDAWKHACGYAPWNRDEQDEVEHRAETEPSTTGKQQGVLKAIIEHPGIDSTNFGKFQSLVKQYPRGERMRTVIKDLITDANGDFHLLGCTKDKHQTYVTFPVSEETVEKFVNVNENTEFEIEIDRMLWKRTEKERQPYENTEGVAVIMGINPNPIFTTHKVH